MSERPCTKCYTLLRLQLHSTCIAEIGENFVTQVKTNILFQLYLQTFRVVFIWSGNEIRLAQTWGTKGGRKCALCWNTQKLLRSSKPERSAASVQFIPGVQLLYMLTTLLSQASACTFFQTKMEALSAPWPSWPTTVVNDQPTVWHSLLF